ncbi:hypothetical protein [Haloarchaeobius amylolyticus]|uniref:hypothetical protein n=1 Tax=Haloarchaeobius amylolyticus TaxID=1198296 RepID=UPI002271E351|nr:hypothetical protein [Haloarchaeobius amylolyticus]
MNGIEYFAAKILGGAAKGTASTLLNHQLKDNSSHKSPVSKPEDCFWGADNQLYCPVNKLSTQQNCGRRQGYNVDPQLDISSTEFEPIEDRPWERETYTRELDGGELDLSLTSEDSTASPPPRTRYPSQLRQHDDHPNPSHH